MAKNKIKVGLIGFGLSGRYLQAPFFVKNEAFDLKTIVTSQDISESSFPNVKKSHSFDDVLADKEIELISICSPNATHYSYAKKALQAGKHVLLEKPMAANSVEAKDLIKISSELNKVLCVFHNRRFDSDFLTVRKIIDSNLLGELVSFEASWERFRPELSPKAWKEESGTASGLLYDLGTHLLDQTICLFGKPKKVDGEVFIQRSGSKIDDAFNLRLDYGLLKVTLKSSLMAKEQGPRYVIHGSNGSFVKYGMDIQEDHLRANILPGSLNFGIESKDCDGTLNLTLKGLEFYGKTETLPGNWMNLFDSLAAAIRSERSLFLDLADVVLQLEIIETILGKHQK